MADTWLPQDLSDSRHIWLPVQLAEGKLVTGWQSEWEMSWFNKKH